MNDQVAGGAGGHDHGEMLWRAEAVDEVHSVRDGFQADHPIERVSLDALAGRVLADDVVAIEDVPARDHATMDGYAVRADDA